MFVECLCVVCSAHVLCCLCVRGFICLSGWLVDWSDVRVLLGFFICLLAGLCVCVCIQVFHTRVHVCVCACVRVCLYRQNYHYVFASWCDRCLCVWMHVLSMHIICVTRQYSYTVLHLKIRVYSIIQLCSLCAHATHMGQHAHAHTSKAFHIHTKLRVRGLG